MTKEELKKETEESAEKFFEKLFNFIDWFAPDRATNDLVTQMLICIQDKFYSMQKETVDLEEENRALKSLLYCTKRSCNNCGKVNCENFQRQRIDCCGLWVSYKDYINKLEKEYKLLGERCNQLLKDKGDLTDRFDNQTVAYETLKLHDQEEIGMLNSKVEELEQQIEKMKRHCNCKHRDSEGYCEVKRTYLMDLSYDGCDKWELED